jgi:hypothetical protein
MAVMEHYGDVIATRVDNIDGVRILTVGGAQSFDIRSHVNALISEAWSANAPTVAIPIECLPEEFFQLRSGLAVAMSQKLVNYRITVAFVGDIDGRLGDSAPFADFIRDCNRGRWIWFVDSMKTLVTRLAAQKL